MCEKFKCWTCIRRFSGSGLLSIPECRLKTEGGQAFCHQGPNTLEREVKTFWDSESHLKNNFYCLDTTQIWVFGTGSRSRCGNIFRTIKSTGSSGKIRSRSLLSYIHSGCVWLEDVMTSTTCLIYIHRTRAFKIIVLIICIGLLMALLSPTHSIPPWPVLCLDLVCFWRLRL